ncbi:MAG TPA: hypothetical protein VFR37_17450 [Longimicrobium sp.]|nr:hypothetical protein [Longimicrobium sp.]
MEDPRSTNGAVGGDEPQAAGQPGATPRVTVKPLDYTQLRLLAECAVGITDEKSNFYFTHQKPEPELKLSKEDLDSLGDGEVVIPAFDEEKYPRNAVTLKVGKDVVVDDPAMPKPGVADAIFWSDAAVQKFVFPYVASCAGTGAATMLQQLQAVWNAYPDTVVVYALIHINRFVPGVSLDLGKAFWVVYELVENGETQPGLLMASLDIFTNKYLSSDSLVLPPPPPSPTAVDYHRGAGGTPQRPDYTTLRALAEWACSIRDVPAYFRFKAGEHGFTGPHKHLPHEHPGDIVVPVLTPTVPAGRPQLEGVWFQAADSTELKNLAQTGDALFWSTGAIEQFLYPYYASKGGLSALTSLVRMAYVWTGTIPEVEPVDGGESFRTGVQPEVEVVGDEVFALIHLYTSEWVEETSQPQGEQLHTRVDPEREMGMVAGDGTVTRLHDYLSAHHSRQG